MRKIIFSALILLVFISCDKKKESKETFLPDASGAINNVSVVAENDLWDGRVGDAVRAVLTKPIYGLPQDEPTFTISQIPIAVFSGFVTKNRTILITKIGNESRFNITENVYAKPQKVITISGKNKDDIIEILNENELKIRETFKNEELAARQQQMAISPHNFKVIKEKLGLTLQFASVYRKAQDIDGFFWFRKDITTGTNNLLVYALPLEAIKRNDSVVNQIIKIRDSIGKTYIEGPVEGSFMVTEDDYAPFITETIIDNKPTFVTRGIWDVKNAFMAGPFINYAIEDKINNRWVVIEGFSFAPSVEKRDYMLELESIIRSVKID